MPGDERFAVVRSLLESHGWTLVRIRGSHHIFEKTGETTLVIPVHRNRVKVAYVKLAKKRIFKAGESGGG